MSSTDAPNWWADVQQEREDLAEPVSLARRPADDWLGEDIDFIPRRRMSRPAVATAVDEPVAPRFTADRDGIAHPLHGVFVPTAPHAPIDEGAGSPRRKGVAAPIDEGAGSPRRKGVVAPVDDDAGAPRRRSAAASVREVATTSRTIELTVSDETASTTSAADMAHELAHLSAADDPFATPPPPAGTRRTVQIKGRPTESRMPSMAQRHRGRTASDRVGTRPDRIALWAVALGAILILLAAMTSSSQAAVIDHPASAPATTAHVVHAAAPLPAPLRHHH
jgi:hypothetical protein